MVAKFEEIVEYARSLASDMLAVQNDFEVVADQLSNQLAKKYAFLSASAINEILICVHFYTCR
ncbi:MAG: hypothetical protein EOO68_04720 [Moraxellaceae bacterium]|nr:MAG: hypothetical protein EOO68_04720 [Moraxellaceae bacterium]